MAESVYKFVVLTPLGFTVRTTETYWQKLLLKHPDIADYELQIQHTLSQPDQICRSQRDDHVLLFYRGLNAQRWLVAVARRLNGEGYLITAYQTDAIKAGEQLWPR